MKTLNQKSRSGIDEEAAFAIFKIICHTKNATSILFAIFFCWVVSGCANLNHINNFSKTANQAISSYNDVGYNFSSSYNHYTLPSNLYSFNGDISRNMLLLPTRTTTAGEPQIAQKADEAITFYITSICSYFQGLSKLSDKDLVNYNFDEVSKNIKADSQLKSLLKITDDSKIDAAASIAKVFTNEITGAYRENRIKKIMVKYDGSVSTSITTLVNILRQSVLPHLANDKDLIDGKYSVALKNPFIDVSKKIDLIDNYYTEQAALDKPQQQILAITAVLQQIKDEHNETVNALQTEKLSSKTVIDIIAKNSAEVYQLYTNIKSLTLKN